MKITNAFVPRKYAYRQEIAAGVVEQLSARSLLLGGELEPLGEGLGEGAIFRSEGRDPLYLFTGKVPPGTVGSNALKSSGAKKTRPELLLCEGAAVEWVDQVGTVPQVSPETVTEAQRGSFRFAQEDRSRKIKGLRPPQIGAVHAVLGHWSVTEEPATVVMPTGTGKTETMLALMAHGGFKRLLVLVPSVALREQTVRKFLSMGLLSELGAIDEAGTFPVVGTLLHELHSVEEVDELFEKCNAVVGIVPTVARSSDEVLKKISDVVSHVFIDEAHHVAAATWDRVRSWLRVRPLVQFTATPYRQDGKRVEGKVVYSYPLSKAQAEDYFRPIRYRPVFEFTQEKGDAAIADKAVEILQKDFGDGHDHLVMARVNNIERAKELFALYESKYPELNPVIVYSQGMSQRSRNEALSAIRSRRSRVVICVNMLGEGFDLPQLKIAALHDIHKSLAITLQFTGRFTRPSDNVGEAAMVVNAGDVTVDRALRELYSEDADWDGIIRKLGEEAIEEKEKQSEVLESFQGAKGSVSAQSLEPKMSTVIFRTKCEEWTPHNIQEFVGQESFESEPAISDKFNSAFFVTKEKVKIQWGNIKAFEDTVYHLYLLHWDAETNLLYINSSNKGHQHVELAKVVCGDGAELIWGEDIYRALSGIKRLTLLNLGLSHTNGRAIRHEMLNGTDVVESLPTAKVTGKRKTNLFGRGYDDNGRASVGCSTKGRIWSHEAAKDISLWIEWCHGIGAKVTNKSISTDAVLQGAIKPVLVTVRPKLIALSVDWNDETYGRSEETFFVRLGDRDVPFYEVGLSITEFKDTGPIRFRVHSDDDSADYEGVFGKDGIAFRPIGEDVEIKLGRRALTLSQLFNSEPPKITLEGDNYIEDNLFISVRREEAPSFDKNAIEAWDWKGVDLKKESQRKEKRADSIQRRVLDWLDQDPTWELIFDDDSSGEAADIVAVKRSGYFVIVRLIHCKFASTGKAGKNVKDLYEVCGQAQKCIRWREKWENFFAHLRRRERKRINDIQPSRIERGGYKLLAELVNQSRYRRPKFEVWIVQPGISKKDVSDDQLRLLGAAETFLAETWSIPMHVIGSE